ncbi:hypothetical protein ATN84_22440 [Paramesorhizobium deserti]|uniref:Uncharacterized protein n=1 Tax=Paramesorhizobium deserti TaxID=1494590 RepID=A0A135HNA6_9HYPH|nr:VCBS repeat-containing protein [Paramesorhizobium deserti]KXF74660.1 hypothetical protein ATN84_22440 [Paramesorhizobium deserti]
MKNHFRDAFRFAGRGDEYSQMAERIGHIFNTIAARNGWSEHSAGADAPGTGSDNAGETHQGNIALVQMNQYDQNVNVYFFEQDGAVSLTPSQSTYLGDAFKGSFSPEQNSSSWNGIADVTGDGVADLVNGNAEDQEIRVVAGKADGTFDTENVIVTDMSEIAPDQGWTGGGAGVSYSTFLVDVTSDGIPDWVHSNAWDGTVSVYEGQGDGTFSTAAITSGDLYELRFANGGTTFIGNAGSDGLALVSINSSDSVINVQYFLTDGTLETVSATTNFMSFFPEDMPVSSFSNDLHSSTFLADVTGDGLSDLIAGENGSILVLEGRSDGTFGYSGISTDMSGVDDWTGGSNAGRNAYASTSLEDVTGDGVLDWVHLSSDYGLQVFRGVGDGYFSDTPVTTPVESAWGWNSGSIAHIGAGGADGDIGELADVAGDTHAQGSALVDFQLADEGINLDFAVRETSGSDGQENMFHHLSAEDIVGFFKTLSDDIPQLPSDGRDHVEVMKFGEIEHSPGGDGYQGFDVVDHGYQNNEEHMELLVA